MAYKLHKKKLMILNTLKVKLDSQFSTKQKNTAKGCTEAEMQEKLDVMGTSYKK